MDFTIAYRISHITEFGGQFCVITSFTYAYTYVYLLLYIHMTSIFGEWITDKYTYNTA